MNKEDIFINNVVTVIKDINLPLEEIALQLYLADDELKSQIYFSALSKHDSELTTKIMNVYNIIESMNIVENRFFDDCYSANMSFQKVLK